MKDREDGNVGGLQVTGFDNYNRSFQREKDELNLLRKQLAPLLELKSTLIKEGILQEEL